VGAHTAWYRLLVAVFGILSRCQSLWDLDRRAIRHHSVVTEALALELWLPHFDSAFRCFFQQVDVAPICTANRNWAIINVTDLTGNLDQLKCNGKALRAFFRCKL